MDLTEDENILICAFSFGFAYYNFQTQSVSKQIRIEDQWPGIRMNDGRLDPQGRFWAGSMAEDHDRAPPHGARLYSIEGDRVKTHLSDVEISNGLAWSLSGDHMFFTDTPTQKIYRYDYNQDDGSLSNKTLFAQLPSGAIPDGSIVDREDYLWNAQWGAAKVVRYSSKGHEDYELKLPVSQPTCLTFGGDDMNIIFITTAREGLSGSQLENEPEAGNLFIYKSNVTGLKSNQFYKLTGNETNE